MRRITLIAALLLAACQPNQEAAQPAPSTYDVEIRWTSYGIPHVKATDWGSLGYGFAYATATDAICVIARDVLLVNGELSKHHGPDEGRFDSDVFHKGILTDDKVAAFNQAQNDRDLAFADGYVAGYNRYVRDHAESLPESCAGASWVAAIDADDLTRLTLGVGIRYGLGRFRTDISQAAPVQATESDQVASQPTSWRLPDGIGSNGVAIGSALSASGRGILLGNPHYPWHGSSRFHLIHTTLPGEVDVMGASLLNTSRVAVGFNKDVAWTHTVSTALRFTLYQLQLNPDNPLQYRYDGAYRDIEPRIVEVEVATEDGTAARQQTIYLTHYGPHPGERPAALVRQPRLRPARRGDRQLRHRGHLRRHEQGGLDGGIGSRHQPPRRLLGEHHRRRPPRQRLLRRHQRRRPTWTPTCWTPAACPWKARRTGWSSWTAAAPIANGARTSEAALPAPCRPRRCRA